MKNYKAISKIGEGTFSEVLKIQSLRDGGFYACKQMKQRFNSVEQVNHLREIQALRRLNPHPNILTLHEVVFDRKSGSLALICELMDMNIYELIRGRRRPLSERKVMNYMYQLCKSLDHMHRNGIFHRDVKPENILVKQDVLKLGDFGSCRSVYSRQPYTEYISTRWYRAPECLLTDGFYTSKMDLWSAGCVFYEIARDQESLSQQPICPRSASLSCMQWWPMTRTSASLPTRPCSTPTFGSRGRLRCRPGPAAGTRASRSTTNGQSRRTASSPWPQHRPWRTSLVTRWFRRETFTWQWPHVLFCWGWRCTPHPTLCPFIPEGHTCRRHPVCPVVPGHLHVPLPSLALSRSEGLLGTGSPRHCRESLTAEPSVPPQPHGWPWYWLCLGHGM
ncbi:MAPK/MAK/MRK overlapping kinase isoform X11 [Fukomys damarensis]|uniref:MAPK/MAK/MRK overlapping kinase isoform X11 n=1 Tax=Fukomys damarensis TaxID=885580 RepID=UPI0014559BB4|nr:MAPK/MAK/MRK overlapping kinase isoform X11 [Fukomys damarensis]